MLLPQIDGPGCRPAPSTHGAGRHGPTRRRLRLAWRGTVALAGPRLAPTATPSRALASGPHSRAGTETATLRPAKADHRQLANPDPPAAYQATSSPPRSGTPASGAAVASAGRGLAGRGAVGRTGLGACPCCLTAPRQKGGPKSLSVGKGPRCNYMSGIPPKL